MMRYIFLRNYSWTK